MVLVSKNKLTAIADAIRAKEGTTADMKLDDMPTKIDSLGTGSSRPVYMKVSTTEEDPVYNIVIEDIGTYYICTQYIYATSHSLTYKYTINIATPGTYEYCIKEGDIEIVEGESVLKTGNSPNGAHGGPGSYQSTYWLRRIS